MITAEDVAQAQKEWGEGIVAIGKAFTDKGDFVKAAENHLDTLYDFQSGDVLFKPTKAADAQFRPDREGRFPTLSVEMTSMQKTTDLPSILGLMSVLKTWVPTSMVTMPWPWVTTFLLRLMALKSRLNTPSAIIKVRMES